MIGKVIQGYEIVETVGTGAMGVVYKAKDPNLPRFVAVKVMSRHLVSDTVFVERFRLEAGALAMVQNPHIIAVHTLIDTPEDLAIVMEFVDGRSLHELGKSKQMPVGRALRIIRQALIGLGAAHRAGIVHRDIKPANILVGSDDLVKIVDFGLAKAAHLDLNLTQTGAQAGTLHYMAPEQIEGFTSVGPQSDLYSLGMTLYKLVCGRLPFSNPGSTYSVLREIVELDFPPADQFNPKLSEPLVQYLSRSIEKRPEDRFQSAGQMIEALDAIVAGSTGEDETLDSSGSDSEAATFVGSARVRGRNSSSKLGLAVRLGIAVLFAVISVVAVWWTSRPEAETSSSPGLQVKGDGGGLSPEIEGALASKEAGPTSTEAGPDSGASAPTSIGLLPVSQADTVATETPDAGPTPVSTKIAVRVVPQGRVTLSGEVRSGADFQSGSFSVSPGVTKVRVQNSEFGSWTKNVRVTEGGSARVRVDFTKLIPINITSKASNGDFLSGAIFVDGVAYGSETPKQIRVRVGDRVLEVRKSDYRSDPVRLLIERELQSPIRVVLTQTGS